MSDGYDDFIVLIFIGRGPPSILEIIGFFFLLGRIPAIAPAFSFAIGRYQLQKWAGLSLAASGTFPKISNSVISCTPPRAGPHSWRKVHDHPPVPSPDPGQSSGKSVAVSGLWGQTNKAGMLGRMALTAECDVAGRYLPDPLTCADRSSPCLSIRGTDRQHVTGQRLHLVRAIREPITTGDAMRLSSNVGPKRASPSVGTVAPGTRTVRPPASATTSCMRHDARDGPTGNARSATMS